MQYWFYFIPLTIIYYVTVTLSYDAEFNQIISFLDLSDKLQNETKPFKKTVFKKLNRTSIFHDDINNIKQYLSRLIDKGKVIIVSTAKCVEEKVTTNTKKVFNAIHRARKEFSEKLKNYSAKLLKDKPIYNVDKEFILLDLAETANNLLHDESKQVMYEIINNSNKSFLKKNNATQERIRFLEYDILRSIIEAKKEEFDYLCLNFKICRPYSAYSNHLTDFLNELLKLSDVKLDYFIMNAVVLLKEQNHFFDTVLGEKLADSVAKKLAVLSYGDTSQMRRIIFVLQQVLGQRYRFDKSKTKKDVKSKAIHILLDIVDKSFSDEEVLRIFFDNTLRSIKKWSIMKEYDVTTVIGNFIRYTIDTFKCHWKKETQEEVKTLVEVILRKKATNKEVFENLFSKGSKFVNMQPQFDIDFL